MAVGIGGIAQAVAHQVERQHRDDDDEPGISSQGASASVWIFCASCSSTPQLIAGGRMPRPRNDSDVSLMIITGMASELVAMMWLRNVGTM